MMKKIFVIFILVLFITSCSDRNAPSSHNVGGTVANAIDLGDGLLWADHNLGATNPEDYGCYFAWGDIRPYSAGKLLLEPKEYPYASVNELGYVTYTKYNGSDGKRKLDPEDDPASVYWGDGWRTPTENELDHIMYNLKWTREKLNGIWGVRATSLTNGNSIFFPAASAGRNNSRGDYFGSRQYDSEVKIGTLAFSVDNEKDWENGADDMFEAVHMRIELLTLRPVKDK